VLRNHQPDTGLATKFSIEFAMVGDIAAKRAGLGELTDDFVQRPDIQALMRTVDIITTAEYDPAAPGAALHDSIRIELDNGHSVAGEPMAHDQARVPSAHRRPALRQVRRVSGGRQFGHSGRCAVPPAVGDPVHFGTRTDRPRLSRWPSRQSLARRFLAGRHGTLSSHPRVRIDLLAT
jgi:hypothetical protein